MTRGVVKNGVIVPIDPLPEEWADGRELWIEEVIHAKNGNQPLEEWIQEVEKSAAEVDQKDWEEMQAVLDAMHKEAKEQVRREMGLSERTSNMRGVSLTKYLAQP